MMATLDVPKNRSEDIARARLYGVQAGLLEVLADDASRAVKTGLSQTWRCSPCRPSARGSSRCCLGRYRRWSPYAPGMRIRWRRRPSSEPLTAVLLPEPLRTSAVRAARQDGEVSAVRLVRERTGLGLLPAVLAVRAAVVADDV